MMLDAEKWAKMKGFECVCLSSLKEAENFYKKLGYSQTKSKKFPKGFLEKQI